MSRGLPPDFGLSDTLMPMWWNENEGSETVLRFGALDRPRQIVGGISGQMSTEPVFRLCAITSSFWNKVQDTFAAAGLVPHQDSLRSTSIEVPLIQFTNLYGPVPTGCELTNFWILVASMPVQMCCGMIGTARPGLNACGCEKCSTRVVALGASVETMLVTHW